MNKTARNLYIAIVSITIIVLVGIFFRHLDFAVLSPQGIIAEHERRLVITVTLLSLLIVIPVFALTFGIVWKYRASNTTAVYKPDWDSNRMLETVWWGFPLTIIVILSVITWQSTHQLDPMKPIASNTPPITIQVVALQWKWLFIYPEQGIATVNYVEIPEKTPVNFTITSDAPMNSFWIPKLGGQVYAMSGMTTHLQLMANRPGSYNGVSANISGEGFADMSFVARSSTKHDFKQWVSFVRRDPHTLTQQTYDQLRLPGSVKDVRYYSSSKHELYDTIVMKYMMPKNGDTTDMLLHGSSHNMAAH